MADTVEKIVETTVEILKKVKIDRESLLNVMHKALCISKEMSLLDSIALRMEKSSITFAKIEADSVASFGKMNASGFKTYEVENPPFNIVIKDINRFIAIIDNLQGETITIEKMEDKLELSPVLLATKKKKTIPIYIYRKDENEFNERFWKKNLKMKKIEEHKFPCMSISLKADQFDEDDEKHSPLLAHLLIDVKKLKEICKSDLITLKGNDKDITIETVQYGGANTYYKENITPMIYKPIVDNFQVRIAKSYLDLVVCQFTGMVNITVAKKYVMFMESKKTGFFGYLIGTNDDSFIYQVFTFYKDNMAHSREGFIPFTNKTNLEELTNKHSDGILERFHFEIRFRPQSNDLDEILEELGQQTDAVLLLKEEKENIQLYDNNKFRVANTDLFQKALDHPAILLEIDYDDDDDDEELGDLEDVEEDMPLEDREAHIYPKLVEKREYREVTYKIWDMSSGTLETEVVEPYFEGLQFRGDNKQTLINQMREGIDKHLEEEELKS